MSCARKAIVGCLSQPVAANDLKEFRIHNVINVIRLSCQNIFQGQSIDSAKLNTNVSTGKVLRKQFQSKLKQHAKHKAKCWEYHGCPRSLQRHMVHNSHDNCPQNTNLEKEMHEAASKTRERGQSSHGNVVECSTMLGHVGTPYTFHSIWVAPITQPIFSGKNCGQGGDEMLRALPLPPVDSHSSSARWIQNPRQKTSWVSKTNVKRMRTTSCSYDRVRKGGKTYLRQPAARISLNPTGERNSTAWKKHAELGAFVTESSIGFTSSISPAGVAKNSTATGYQGSLQKRVMKLAQLSWKLLLVHYTSSDELESQASPDHVTSLD